MLILLDRALLLALGPRSYGAALPLPSILNLNHRPTYTSVAVQEIAGTLDPSNPRGLLDSRQPSSTEVPMRRIGLAVILAVSLTLAPFAVEAQTEKVYRIGILERTSPANNAANLDGFRRARTWVCRGEELRHRLPIG
jgi:hypothetical protein